MADRKFTLFEYHSHDGGIELFSKGGVDDEETAPPATRTGPNTGVAVVIGLAFLIVAGAVVRYMQKKRQGAEDDFHQVEVTEFES